MTDHYDAIGVPRSATPEEIRKAYRKARGRAHPDKGGSHERMTALTVAYRILSDPDSRAHYDRTGEESKSGPSLDELAVIFIRDVLDKLIERCGEHSPDFVRAMRDAAREGIRNADLGTRKAEERIKRLERMLPDVEAPEGENHFATLIEQKIEQQRHALDTAEQARKIAGRALEMLKPWKSKVKPAPGPAFSNNSIFITPDHPFYNVFKRGMG